MNHELLSQAYRFAERCRSPPTRLDVGPACGCFPNIPKVPGIVEAAIHWEVEGKASHLLTACILDDGMDWPSFWSRGQIGVARSAHVFFKRESPAVRARVTETMEHLCKTEHGGAMGWVGNPGIGNSAGLNEILVTLLRALGQPGFPAVVGFRVNTDVIIWRWNAISTTVSVSVERKAWDNGIFEVSRAIAEENGALVVDPQDYEDAYPFRCAAVIALSNRDAYGQLKENAYEADSVLLGPWALSECTAAAWVESRLGREDLGYTLSEVMETVRERWEHVGGLPRFVLGSEIEYRERVRLQDAVVDLDWRIRHWYVNAKPAANFFISTEPQTGHETAWQFLCPSRAAAYLRLVESRRVGEQWSLEADSPFLSNIESSLYDYGLRWQIYEQFLCEGLLAERKIEWHWYPDFGTEPWDPSTKLASPPLGFKPLSASELFEGQFLWRNVVTLDTNKLYRSTCREGLYRFFSFDPLHKVVFLYRVSQRKWHEKKELFQISHFAMWRNALQLPDDWTLTTVYFEDISLAPKVPLSALSLSLSLCSLSLSSLSLSSLLFSSFLFFSSLTFRGSPVRATCISATCQPS